MLNPFKRLVIKGVPFDVKDGGAVRFDESTDLTDAEKARARANIGAVNGGVTSVNGQTGVVELDAEDVGALPDSTVIPSKTSDLQNDSGFITSQQAPVQSVNGQSGVVELDADDVGALPSSTVIPSKTSDLQNDSGFITSQQAPVQSVDGKTGSVSVLPIGGTTETVLTKNDVNDYNASWKQIRLHYGQVDSSSTATAFTATIPGVTALEDGAFCLLKNGVVTSASGCTLDVNGLGAKPIYQTLAGATAITTQFNINYTMLFVYDTTRVSTGCWLMFYGYNTDNNTIGYQIRTANMSMPVDGATYRYRLLFQHKDGNKFVPANTSSSTSATAAKTVNQTPINPFGVIMYYSTTTAVSSGSKPNASYLWEQYNDVALGYSFNVTGSALTLTISKPVYLKCAPQSDGTAIIDSATPFVQDLPTTEDGKIYIFLGIASSATQLMFMFQHPVYYFKDNAIRVWTNPSSSGGGGGAVDSVNGQTGVVVLDASDVGSINYYNSVTQLGLTSGSATIGDAYNALPDNSILLCNGLDFSSTEVPSQYGTVEILKLNGTGERGIINYRAKAGGSGSCSVMYLTSQGGTPTGTWVELASKDDIPVNTSELTNDSGFITYNQAPVQSVNGQTGAVTLAYEKPWTLLWTNSSPTTDFAPQTISLNLTDYNEIKIVMGYRTNNLVYSTIIVSEKGLKTGTFDCNYLSDTNFFLIRRLFESSDSGIVFEDALRRQFAPTVGSSSVQNSYSIPLRIYAR